MRLENAQYFNIFRTLIFAIYFLNVPIPQFCGWPGTTYEPTPLAPNDFTKDKKKYKSDYGNNEGAVENPFHLT